MAVGTLIRRLDTMLSDVDPEWISRMDRLLPTSSRPVQLSPPPTTFTSSMTAPKPTVASSSYASSLISRSLPPSSTAVHSSTRPNITSRGVLCECGIPALVRTNKSGINSIGKNFYICPKDSCGFWKWVDDVESSVSATSSNVIVPAKRTYTQVRLHVFALKHRGSVDR